MRVFCLFCLLVMLSTGVTTAQQPVPRFQSAECQFDTEFLPEVECGYLHVMEDRSNPNSPVLQLHVAIFRSYSSNPAPDPVIYLDGGPGANALESASYSFYYTFEPFLEKRDFIIIDQRGTGYSRPLSLGCQEYGNMLYDTLDEELTPEESARLMMEAMTRCQNRLTSRGVNLAAYTSAENAADLADLREVLGYESWNLYGISYGTRLALTTMRDHPGGIRSVIIDSVVPPQVSLYDEEPANAEHAFNTLFLHCTMDAACNARYPRLGTVFYEMVARLNERPASAIITHPVTTREYEVLVDGDRLVGLVFSALYSADLIPLLPKIIYDVRDGNYTLLASTLEGILYDEEGFSMGMHFSVQCSEEVPFTSLESVDSSAAAFPLIRSYFDEGPNSGLPIFELCEIWGTTPPRAIENEPVISQIPTLVLSGEFDPITPPRWGTMAASTLTNSYNYEIPSVGHGASLSHPCALDITLRFLDNPFTEPNTDCIAEIAPVEFLIVDNSINLIPFDSPDLGISGVRPESWEEVDYGIYQRSEIDEVMLIYDVVDGLDQQNTLKFIAEDFNIYIRPEPMDTVPTDNLTWRVYQFREGETVLDVALAEQNDTTYIVVLVCKRFEELALYESVLVPALRALRMQ